MQIIIPLTGNGSRFKAAGYEKLKPFIEVHGKPIIEWVVKMFKGDEDNIIFICRKEHLENLDYVESTLKRIAPNAKIFTIENWVKKGPVHDVLEASSIIDDNEPAIISYCDYYMHWDYTKYKKDLLENKADGSIPCYSGFHPHLVPDENLYASCKVDENDNLIEIREKFSWHEDKTKTYHSPGAYYFKTGAILKKYCNELLNSNDSINGEYYASLVYNFLVKDNLKVWCPINVDYFCQWGTPKDLEQYLYWVETFKNQKEIA